VPGVGVGVLSTTSPSGPVGTGIELFPFQQPLHIITVNENIQICILNRDVSCLSLVHV